MAQAVVRLTHSVACTGLHGPYVHAWVAVRDLQAFREEDGSWQDLTPDLPRHPLQVDLLGATDGGGFLATLGTTSRLPAGRYTELRLFLVTPRTAYPETLCAPDSPCVTLQIGGVVPLETSADADNGFVIGPERILGGVWKVRPDHVEQLTLFWNACASILPESNNQFRLAPVLSAGSTSPSMASIEGRVIDASMGQPPSGGNVMVALEYPDPEGVDRVAMVTNADADGYFLFPSVPKRVNGDASTVTRWHLVFAAISGLNAAYAPVVVTGVPAGSDLGDVELSPLPARNTAPVALYGEVRDAGATESFPAVVMVSALLPVTTENGVAAVTVPLMQQGQAMAMLVVEPDAMMCPPGVACSRYTLAVPAEGAQVGAWRPELARIVWMQAPTESSVYRVEASRLGETPYECDTTLFVDVEAVPGSLQLVPTFDMPGCQ